MKRVISILAMIIVLVISTNIVKAQENSVKTKQKVALALSCGGAHGTAHIGVIRELEKQGYEISCISGSSMGALVGGVYAAGKLDEYESWLCSLSKMDVFNLLDFTLNRQGIIRANKVLKELQKFIPDQNIEDLPIRYAAVATDLKRGEEVVITEGSLFDAIRASVSIPMVLTPAFRNDTLLVDGGVLNPLPANRVFRQEGDILIAVDVIALIPYQDSTDNNSDQGYLKQFTSNKQSGLQKNKPGLDSVRFIENPGYLSITSETISLMLSQISKLTLQMNPPDILIEISRYACGTFDYHKATELIELGKKATIESLEKYSN